MRRGFELRYQVYCEECHFLHCDDYPDGCERDAYDAISAHFCCFNRSDELVGYVRLIAADAAHTFPFQKHCRTLFDGVVLPPSAQSVEVSRLVVQRAYRRRRGDKLYGTVAGGDPAARAPDLRGHFPQLLMSLYRQMYRYSVGHGIRYWYAAMERGLPKVLEESYINFRPIGPSTDYYGQVAPYLADLRELEAGLARNNPALMAWLQKPELPGV